MGEHTKGPWVCFPQADWRSILIATQHKYGCGIAEVWIDLAPYAESAEANARLIAAAPELLEALKRCEQALSAYQVECGPLMTPGIDAEEVTNAARAAIKKARGGE